MRLSLLLAFGIMSVGVLPVAGQGLSKGGLRPLALRKGPDKPSRYFPFSFDGDAEQRVNNQLRATEALDPFRDLIDKALRDPEKFKLDAATVKNLKLKDPQLEQQIKDWVARQPPGKLPSAEELAR